MKANEILISGVAEHRKDWRAKLVEFITAERKEKEKEKKDKQEKEGKESGGKSNLGEPAEPAFKKVKMSATYNRDTKTTTLHGETVSTQIQTTETCTC
jgi:hypothetical protein